MSTGKPKKKGPRGPSLNIEMPSIPVAAKPPVALDDKCTMELEPGIPTEVRAQDLERIKELGRGAYGVVETMKHVATGTIMAVKVRFYGAMFREGDVWICMEVMDTSLDKFYRMCEDQRRPIPEPVLGKIALAVTSALHYMRSELDLMHRDVKPSNILADKRGNIKICDFGISGHLTDSVAKTINAGCKPYMAPERINPNDPTIKAYDVRSDVWSLGITILEIAQGFHPYAKWKTPFEQLKQVVYETPPTLPQDRNFSPQFHDFLQKCLMKEHKERPRYHELLEHPWLVRVREDEETDVGAFVNGVLSDVESMRNSLLPGEGQENGDPGASS